MENSDCLSSIVSSLPVVIYQLRVLVRHPVALMLREPPCRATLREIVRMAGHRLVLLLQIVVGMVLAAVADSLPGSVARWLALGNTLRLLSRLLSLLSGNLELIATDIVRRVLVPSCLS